jgi:hypothetical protein
MVSRRSVSKALLVLVVFAVVGGISMALLAPEFSGQLGGMSAGPALSTTGGTTILGDYFGGIQDTVSGGSSFAVSGNSSPVPSTVVLGAATVTYTASATTTETSQGAQGPSTNGTAQSSSGHSIEFFGNLTLSVADPSAALQKAGAVASGLGGYVAYSTYGTSVAIITVRVPSQNYQEALTQLESLGTVVGASTSSDDVSVQYTDLNASLQSLLTEQTSLLKLLNQSSSVNATLSIESVLQQTDAQINSVESSILQTSQLIDYATIGVNFVQTQASYTPLSLKLSATPLSGMSPLSVTFSAAVKGGEPSYFVNYNFGDGTSAQGQQLIHQFTQSGRYNVTVSATDQAGNVSLAWIVVNVTSPPVASGFAAFGTTILNLLARVLEGIAEVAVVVIPIGLVAYFAGAPLYRRYSRSGRNKDSTVAGAPTSSAAPS